jgi:cell division protein FtsW (lipid II flippase)
METAMDIERYLNSAQHFFYTNTTLVIIVGVVLLIMTFLRPKDMFKLFAFCLFLMVAVYCISLFMGTIKSGSEQKDQMIYKTKDVVD